MLEIGKIVNTHGLRGEVKAVAWTDSPEDFEKIKNIIIKHRQGDINCKITNIKYQKNNLILKLSGIDSIEEAEKLKNSVLCAKRDELGPLPDGVYYIADIIGMQVFDENEALLGTVSDVLQTGSRDIYCVKRDGKRDLLLPVIDDVILSVDLDSKKIHAHIMEGLDDEI